MILDTQSKFSDAQAVTVTALATNVLDLRQSTSLALADEGVDIDMWLVVQVGTAFTAAGAATMTITIETDSTADLATSATVHFSTAAIAVATLVAGYRAVAVKLPSDLYERYLSVRYTIATGPMTAGTITAFLTPDLQRNVIYPVGFTVS